MVSGHYVAPNPLEFLAAGLRSAGGMKGEALATKELADIGQREKDMMMSETKALSQALRGTPGQMMQPTTPNDDEGNINPQVQMPGTPGSYDAFLSRAIESPLPQFQQLGMQGLAAMPEREARAAEKEAEREFRVQQMKEQHAMRLEAMREQNASREQMAQAQREFMAQLQQERMLANQQNIQLTAALRPEKNVTVLGPNGEAITLPQSQSAGLPLYNPQAAAAQQKTATKQQAKDQLSTVVSQLNNNYDSLEKGGGITSTAQGPLANIAARVSSTGVGQGIGAALGTDNQRRRQEIEQTRPLLLNLIKEATGMSAQQMNSNAEMNLYLQAATDPKLTVEANRAALANLDKLFGLGLAQPPKDAAGAGASVTVNGQTYTKPANMTAEQWNAYKQSVGAK